jgi:hypothetical protein
MLLSRRYWGRKDKSWSPLSPAVRPIELTFFFTDTRHCLVSLFFLFLSIFFRSHKKDQNSESILKNACCFGQSFLVKTAKTKSFGRGSLKGDRIPSNQPRKRSFLNYQRMSLLSARTIIPFRSHKSLYRHRVYIFSLSILSLQSSNPGTLTFYFIGPY